VTAGSRQASRGSEQSGTPQAATEMAAPLCIENTKGHRGAGRRAECGWKYGEQWRWRRAAKQARDTMKITCRSEAARRWRSGEWPCSYAGWRARSWKNRGQFYAAQKARGKERGALPREPRQGGYPPGPPGPFPLFAMFQNGPRRQGFAAPRKKRAPLTAAGRSENPTEIRERGLVRNGLAASLPLVGTAAQRSIEKKAIRASRS